jgi:Rieske Fe-S protein
VLGFDDDEQTWDCPCHGSRYASDGTVISGPAVRPLDPADLSAAVVQEEDA